MISLCCSFAPLTLNYDYSGLSSFMKHIDYCVFFNSGIPEKTVELINKACSGRPVFWKSHSMTDFSNMRNRLIKCAIKIGGEIDPKENVYVFMIDDCYSIEGDSEIVLSTQVRFNYKINDYYGGLYETKYVKLFEAKKHHYILQVHEVLICLSDEIPVDCSLTIRDISDKCRTTKRCYKDIKMLNDDLYTYYTDNFLRNHIYRYIYNSYKLLGDDVNANKYFLKIDAYY